MKRVIQRELDETCRWSGLYCYYIVLNDFITDFSFYRNLSFESAYEKYLTYCVADLSGDMEHYKETRKIRVPSRGIKW